MIVLFFFVITIIGLIISAVTQVMDILAAISAFIKFITSLPFVSGLVLSGLKSVDFSKFQAGQIPSAIVMASDSVFKGPIGSNLPGISILEVDANGRLRDLFNESSLYHGMNVSKLAALEPAKAGDRLPVLLVDAAKMAENVRIDSPGPIIIYGSGKTKIEAHSKMAIVMANETLSAEGSVLDAPMVIASQLPEGNGIEVTNSFNPNHLVQLVPFSEVRTLAETTLKKMINGEKIENNFSFKGLGKEIEAVKVPEAPSAKAVWKSLKCETGWFFVRCHLRFDREILQSFVNKFVTKDSTTQKINMFGANVDVSVENARVFIKDGKVRLLLDLNAENLLAAMGPSDSGAGGGWLQSIANVAHTAHRTVLQSIPSLKIKNVEIEVDGVNYDRKSGNLFVTSVSVKSFDLSIPFVSDDQMQSIKNIVMNGLNQVIPRYLANRPLYNLGDVKLWGFIPIGKLLLEKVVVESPADHLRLQMRLGPNWSKEKDCEKGLLDAEPPKTDGPA